MTRNILLTLEYDGTGFHGWQRQPAARTVQGELERVLSILCGCDIAVNGTSRTDAGVHALGQRASFSGDFTIPAERIVLAANNLLSGGMNRNSVGDIKILKAEEMPQDFHARFNCKSKRYIYRILNSGDTDIFRRNYCWQIDRCLDAEAMSKAAGYIAGTHDFACFQASGGQERETTVRTIYSLDVCRNDEEIEISVTGDGFLFNMVRIITGTLVEVGKGRMAPEYIEEIISSKDRTKAGPTAPPQGLYLAEVYY